VTAAAQPPAGGVNRGSHFRRGLFADDAAVLTIDERV
jgi:hypothetical protein